MYSKMQLAPQILLSYAILERLGTLEFKVLNLALALPY